MAQTVEIFERLHGNSYNVARAYRARFSLIFYNFVQRRQNNCQIDNPQRQIEAQTPNEKRLEHAPDVKLLCNLKPLFAKNCQILIDFNKGKM